MISKRIRANHNEHNYNTILVDYSALDSVKAGKFYTTVQLNGQLFIFDENGKRILMQEPDVKWKNVDKVVMMAKIKSSHLDTVTADKIYHVFNDEDNNERYIIDENGEKVLFDRMIFQYESM